MAANPPPPPIVPETSILADLTLQHEPDIPSKASPLETTEIRQNRRYTIDGIEVHGATQENPKALSTSVVAAGTVILGFMVGGPLWATAMGVVGVALGKTRAIKSNAPSNAVLVVSGVLISTYDKAREVNELHQITNRAHTSTKRAFENVSKFPQEHNLAAETADLAKTSYCKVRAGTKKIVVYLAKTKDSIKSKGRKVVAVFSRRRKDKENVSCAYLEDLDNESVLVLQPPDVDESAPNIGSLLILKPSDVNESDKSDADNSGSLLILKPMEANEEEIGNRSEESASLNVASGQILNPCATDEMDLANTSNISMKPLALSKQHVKPAANANESGVSDGSGAAKVKSDRLQKGSKTHHTEETMEGKAGGVEARETTSPLMLDGSEILVARTEHHVGSVPWPTAGENLAESCFSYVLDLDVKPSAPPECFDTPDSPKIY